MTQQGKAENLLVRQIAALEGMTLRDLLRELPALHRQLGLGDLTHFMQSRLMVCITQGEFAQAGSSSRVPDGHDLSESLRATFKRRNLALLRDFVLNCVGERGQILWDRMEAVASGELDPNLEIKRHARH